MNKECQCEEISCKIGCLKKHTCKTFWCEKCKPSPKEKVIKLIEKCLNLCKERNGMPMCKNCGLSEEILQMVKDIK